jgi:hypothetical protein
MKKLFFVLSFVYGLSAFAGPIEKLKTENPSDSYYTILQKLYESSTQPAQYSDFDKLGSPSNMHCVSVDKKSNVTDLGAMKVYNYVYEKGHDQQGPLIPAVADKTRQLLVNSTFEDYKAARYLDVVSANLFMQQTSTDLIMGMDKAPDGMQVNGGGLRLFVTSYLCLLLETVITGASASAEPQPAQLNLRRLFFWTQSSKYISINF